MSILIKGIEIPTSCDDCRLNNGITCYAVPEYTEDCVVGRTDDRPDWCPLIELPPHGRLIDADKLKEEFPHDEDWDYPVNTNSYVVETIDKSPAIIEAERI